MKCTDEKNISLAVMGYKIFFSSTTLTLKCKPTEGLTIKRKPVVGLTTKNCQLISGRYTDYHIGFFNLFQTNEKLDKLLEKQLELLSNQEYYRQDISYGIGTMLRELRLPEDQESKWQLLYETTVFPTEESGPILHMYFDGWELKNSKIYYWDEIVFNDISEDEELLAAKNKITAYGLTLDDNIGDEATLMIKKLLDNQFPNDDNNIQGHKWNFGDKNED